ncbi:hypothetical protein GGTG_09678 [Gaeumannomyces tritici R3-111a-1]|uniref:Uncharacterized protein n=1 Tax=Gaeumannomyces tritici (strain R3-111a-1) TaxID=644352 RepID=J3P840_GAET3|nr:hypothetical protein GGTG_09678 [Gaeumannomyces tritici R3-111a-1]EJT72823.1 hypothetical protein GGTG_09678 [Gaeumannomyces tritici R3-111a-1]
MPWTRNELMYYSLVVKTRPSIVGVARYHPSGPTKLFPRPSDRPTARPPGPDRAPGAPIGTRIERAETLSRIAGEDTSIPVRRANMAQATSLKAAAALAGRSGERRDVRYQHQRQQTLDGGNLASAGIHPTNQTRGLSLAQKLKM